MKTSSSFLIYYVKKKKVRTDVGFSVRVRVGRGEVEKDLYGFLLSYYDKRITFNLRKHIYFKHFLSGNRAMQLHKGVVITP